MDELTELDRANRKESIHQNWKGAYNTVVAINAQDCGKINNNFGFLQPVQHLNEIIQMMAYYERFSSNVTLKEACTLSHAKGSNFCNQMHASKWKWRCIAKPPKSSVIRKCNQRNTFTSGNALLKTVAFGAKVIARRRINAAKGTMLTILFTTHLSFSMLCMQITIFGQKLTRKVNLPHRHVLWSAIKQHRSITSKAASGVIF